MSTTLYRKYRPQTFAEVVNQQHIRLTLEQALRQGRLAHAYLFTGPRGIGKTTLARLLARAAACPKRRASDSEPCNACPSCQGMLNGNSLDLIEIDAASQTGVDNVRENVIQSARSVPGIGKYKVFIIDEVHMLSLAAFNALLKLLEEPPAHAIFILATTEIHRVPETIISRTQRFDFKRLAVTDIVVRLERLAGQEKRRLGDGVADRIARAAGGSLRDAESMLGQLFSFDDKVIGQEVADLVLPRSDSATILAILTAVTHRRSAEALVAFHRFCEEGGDIETLAHELVSAARVMLLGTVDPALIQHAASDVDDATVKTLLDLARATEADRAATIVETLLTAERDLRRASLIELPVEVAIVRLGGQIEQPKDQVEPPTRPPVPESPAPTKKRPRAAAPTLDLATVQAAWPAVRKAVQSQSPSLNIALQHAGISAVESDRVHLAVPFALHRDRLNHPAPLSHLAECFSNELGQPVKIQLVAAETPPPPPPAETVTSKPAAAKTAEPAGGADLWDQVVASFQ